MGDHRQISGHVQTQAPGSIRCGGGGPIGRGVAGVRRGSSQDLEGSLWDATQPIALVNHQIPLLRCIQHVIAEAGGESGQPLAGAVEGSLLVTLQTNAPVLHGEQFRIQDALLGGIQRLGWIGEQTAEGLVNDLALTHAIAETNHVRLLARMGFAQFRRVAHRGEMTDDAPAPVQPLAQGVQR